MQDKDEKPKLGKQASFLEYEDDEIHATLLALLRQKGIKPYQSLLSTYQQAHPSEDFIGRKKEQFSPTTNMNLNKLSPRSVNPVIFSHNNKILVNIYPTTLPQSFKMENQEVLFFDFDNKLKEAIFELQNFLYENPQYKNQDIIFTFPVNKGNAHWVQGTIKMDSKRNITAQINDPTGINGILSDEYQVLRNIIEDNLVGSDLAEIGKISTQPIGYLSEPVKNVQRELYCGGATRRMRDATLFSKNNDPYDWQGIDIDPETTINSDYQNSMAARISDLELLLKSEDVDIQKTGKKLLERYQLLDSFGSDFLEEEKIKSIQELYNKYNRFITIEKSILSQYTPDQAERLIVNEIINKFEKGIAELQVKKENEDHIKTEWLAFISDLDKDIIGQNQGKINQINKSLFPFIFTSESKPYPERNDAAQNQDKNPLICYNMVPSEFASIEEMTAYLEKVKAMGFTSIWLNPIQEATDTVSERTDKLTGQTFTFTRSLYAMKRDDLLDPRISPVKRDIHGEFVFTIAQKEKAKELGYVIDPVTIKQMTTLYKNDYEKEITLIEKEIASLETALELESKNETSETDFFYSESNEKKDNIESQLKRLEQIKKDKQLRLEQIQQSLMNEPVKFVKHLEKEALKTFTDEARKKGITPIFDLVLNHVGKDAPFTDEYPQWFKEDASFKDVKAFSYYQQPLQDRRHFYEVSLCTSEKEINPQNIHEGEIFVKNTGSNKITAYYLQNGELKQKEIDGGDLSSHYKGLPYYICLLNDDSDIPFHEHKNTVFLKRDPDKILRAYFMMDNTIKTTEIKSVKSLEQLVFPQDYQLAIRNKNDNIALEAKQFDKPTVIAVDNGDYNIKVYLVEKGKIKNQREFNYGSTKTNRPDLQSFHSLNQDEKSANYLLSKDIKTKFLGLEISGDKKIIKPHSLKKEDIHINQELAQQFSSSLTIRPEDILTFPSFGYDLSLIEIPPKTPLEPKELHLPNRPAIVKQENEYYIYGKGKDGRWDISLVSGEAKKQLEGINFVSGELKYPESHTLCTLISDDQHFQQNSKKITEKDLAEMKWHIIENCYQTPSYQYHEQRAQMINYWKKYIDKYMDEFGFEGVRVDAVRKLPRDVRIELFEYIKSKSKNPNTIILEELLFTEKRPMIEVISEVGFAGGSHITGSAYYKQRGSYGELPQDILEEQGLKNGITSYGTINFTGNHDHYPAATDVLLEMAQKRMWQSTYPSIQKIHEAIAKLEQAKNDIPNKIKDPRVADQHIAKINGKINYYKTIASYPFLQDIQQEIQQQPQGKLAQEFLLHLKDKMTACMFAGSGGYYLLSGDELGNTVPTEIYLRQSGGDVYPRKIHKVFLSNNPAIKEFIASGIGVLAKERLDVHGKLNAIYTDTTNMDEKQRLLSPFSDFIVNEINSGNQQLQQRLRAFLETNQGQLNLTPEDTQALKELLAFKESDFIEIPRFPRSNTENNNINLTTFIKENNDILTRLPRPGKGAWAHSFELAPNVIATIKINDMGFQAPANIVITNLDSCKPFVLGEKEMDNLAQWFQSRCFPKQPTNALDPRSDWSQSWYLLKGDPENTIPPPIIYANRGVIVDETLRIDKENSFIPSQTCMPKAPNTKDTETFCDYKKQAQMVLQGLKGSQPQENLTKRYNQ